LCASSRDSHARRPSFGSFDNNFQKTSLPFAEIFGKKQSSKKKLPKILKKQQEHLFLKIGAFKMAAEQN